MSKRVNADALREKVRISDVIGRDVQLKRTKGHAYLGLCPFHEDSTPSLQVDDEHRNFKCFACGAQGDVIAYVMKRKGLSFLDACLELGEEPEPEPRQKKGVSPPAAKAEEVDCYTYTDEGGAMLFQVVRYVEDGRKTFKQRRVSKTGETIWNLQGVRRVLYRLPAVAEAVEKGRTIYLVEGEKDVQSAEGIGLVATCNPMGAGKWEPDYSEQLKGAAHVVIVQDRDDVGRAHAEAVYDSLVPLVECVDIVESRKGKDLTDHIEAGLPIEDLKRIRTGVRWAKLSEIKPRAVEWLWYPWLAKGKFALIIGDPGEGKSTVCRAIASAVTLGRGLPGVPEAFEPRDVVLLCGEEDPEDTIAPQMLRFEADLERVHLVKQGSIGFDFAGLRQIEQKIAKHDVALVVIDPLLDMFGPKLDIHRQNEVREVMREVIRLAMRTGTSIWGLMHMNKQVGGKAIYRAIGSIDFPAIARTAMMCGHDPDDKNNRAIALYKSNIGPTGIAWAYTIDEEGSFYWLSQSDLDADRMCEVPVDRTTAKMKQEQVEWLRMRLIDSPKSQQQILADAQTVGYATRTLMRAKREAGILSKKLGTSWWWTASEDQWRRFTRDPRQDVEADEDTGEIHETTV